MSTLEQRASRSSPPQTSPCAQIQSEDEFRELRRRHRSFVFPRPWPFSPVLKLVDDHRRRHRPQLAPLDSPGVVTILIADWRGRGEGNGALIVR
ncbi:MAG: hypothetical protein ABWZ26_06855 [Candidatus Nanopelagicales bacterium]